MDWAAIWSWFLTAIQWCFYAFVLYIAVRWWARSIAQTAKIRFIEAKIDALLEHFDVGFEEGFRERIAEVLRERGEAAAKADYILVTGSPIEDAERFLRELPIADDEAEPSEVGPPHGPLGPDELHELVDQVFQQPRRRPRRKRR
jgi:hypothetical protein